jgi:hypothetical protein
MVQARSDLSGGGDTGWQVRLTLIIRAPRGDGSVVFCEPG